MIRSSLELQDAPEEIVGLDAPYVSYAIALQDIS